MTPKTVGPPYISGMSNSTELSNQRDISALSIPELIDSLERYDFECQGGPLSNVVDWRELRARLGHPSPPIQPDPAKIAASAYTRLQELEDDIQRRELGRVSLIAALKAIADRSTSHEEAVRLAQEKLRGAGVFTTNNPTLGPGQSG
jgi:hypothetical protein